MSFTRREILAGSLVSLACAYAPGESSKPPAPFGPLPSPRQLQWQRMEVNAFLHFTVNTFTDKEWGDGDEDPAIFNPTDFDADAVVLALKAGGMKGVILTCKHHDGFCLWPTKTTNHCIRLSPWMGGRGDVVRDLSRAAARHGLKFGVYLSPWDRNNAAYGLPEYIAIYREQLRELLTWYGSVFEVWFDGANGGKGYYGGARAIRTIDKHSYYDWPKTWAMVRQLQPDAVIFSDVGPDVRWVGNEKGIAGETCWATCDPVANDGKPAVPGDANSSVLNTGTRFGSHWMPAECDVSIRPGWFWHEHENNRVKTPAQLFDLYFDSVGRGANLLLNVPPNRSGQLSPQDVSSIEAFHEMIEAAFSRNIAAAAKLDASNVRGGDFHFGPQRLLDGRPDTYWATDDTVRAPHLVIDFGQKRKINVVRLREAIQLGQRLSGFALDVWQQESWVQVAQGTSVGSCRLVKLPVTTESERLRLRITDSPVCIAITELGIFFCEELSCIADGPIGTGLRSRML